MWVREDEQNIWEAKYYTHLDVNSDSAVFWVSSYLISGKLWYYLRYKHIKFPLIMHSYEDIIYLE